MEATTRYRSPSRTRISGLRRMAPVRRPRVVRTTHLALWNSKPSSPSLARYRSTWSAAMSQVLGMYSSVLMAPTLRHPYAYRSVEVPLRG